jgi:hypothetical protein
MQWMLLRRRLRASHPVQQEQGSTTSTHRPLRKAGEAGRGLTWLGTARYRRQGKAGLGGARLGKAWHGEARPSDVAQVALGSTELGWVR